METIRQILTQGANEFGIELDGRALERFDLFTNELLEWNKVMNLTRITQPDEIALKHYVDSIAVLKYVKIENGAKVADIGCGAGFPGIPVKIAREDLSLCCVDSLGKRVNFLKQLTEKLRLQKCECVHARAEEVGAKTPYREGFDYSFARAVAKLRMLSEFCLPLVKIGGAFVAMKGGEDKEEIDEAKNAVKLLGGEIENIYEYKLPQSDMGRTIVVIRKVKATEKKYPRSNAKIAKSPL